MSKRKMKSAVSKITFCGPVTVDGHVYVKHPASRYEIMTDEECCATGYHRRRDDEACACGYKEGRPHTPITEVEARAARWP